MKNITIKIDDQAYRAARMWAAQRGTSISRVVQKIISTLPGLPRAQTAFPLPADTLQYAPLAPKPAAPSVAHQSLPPSQKTEGEIPNHV